ncbi:MAG: hypothetical protein U0L20_06575 [Ruminococcus sp.]|nr:hypothetical protein [Ruminococcus sp.]
MRVRVYNKIQNEYYISEVYGIINRNRYSYIVDDIAQKDKVILVEYLDFETKAPYKVNVEIIDYNPIICSEWIEPTQFQMSSINKKIKNSKPIMYFNGYKTMWDSEQALIDLLENNIVAKSNLGLKNFTTKLDGWNYIESQEDIDYLMNEYKGFHDSVIKEISYISGDYVDNNGMNLSTIGSKKIKVIFNSLWAKEIEIILLSPRICHIAPGDENYLADLYDASIFIKDCVVYFYDSCIDEVVDDYMDTYFKSLGFMWRYV